MEEKKTGGNGLAIASFVLALVGVCLCLTLIGLIFGIICLVLALIFGIVALCKKQTARAAITGIIISALCGIVITICFVFLGRFVLQHKDQLLDPMTEFAAWVEENPEIALLMNNEEFSNQYEQLLSERLEQKYGEKYSDIDSIDGALEIWGDLFEEMKNVATELAEGNTIGLENSEEEVVEEIVEEPVEEVVEEAVEEVVEEPAEEVAEEIVEELVEEVTE